MENKVIISMSEYNRLLSIKKCMEDKPSAIFSTHDGYCLGKLFVGEEMFDKVKQVVYEIFSDATYSIPDKTERVSFVRGMFDSILSR